MYGRPALSVVALLLVAAYPLRARAQNPLATPAADNAIEVRLSSARLALTQLRGKLAPARFEKLDRGLSEAEAAWREVKTLALANNVACPDVLPDPRNQPKGILNPAIIALPAAGAAVAESLLPLVALATVVYAIHRYQVAPEVRNRERFEHALNDLATKLEAVASEAKATLAEIGAATTTTTFASPRKKNCDCLCLGKAEPSPQPDKLHGVPDVGKVPHDAECRAECMFRGFSSYRCN